MKISYNDKIKELETRVALLEKKKRDKVEYYPTETQKDAAIANSQRLFFNSYWWNQNNHTLK